MANLTKSADNLISEVSANVRSELHASIAPITKKIIDAVQELEKALSGTGAATGAKRRGRRPGRPPKKTSAPVKKAAKRAVGAPKKAATGGKRIARGALQAEVLNVMSKSGAPMKLSQLRDAVMKKAAFKKRDPKSLYTQIVQIMKKVPQIEKTASGTYALK